jgi:ubiquinone biosynthesis protein UbiJ
MQALPEPSESASAPRDPASAGESSAASAAVPFGIPFAHELGALLERALNREIAASTAAGDVLASLGGESFAIEVLGFGVRCVLRAQGERIVVDAARVGDRPAASVTLRATPLDLLRLARSADVSSLKGTSAELVGSPEVAERFAALLKLARPDVEDALARWIGDVPAHALARAAQDAGAWLHRAASALRLNTAEFLQEESRALPAALEAQAFYADVERLRDDVERAAVRLALLERRERHGSA